MAILKIITEIIWLVSGIGWLITLSVFAMEIRKLKIYQRWPYPCDNKKGSIE